jgi:hypothetical protein
MEIDLWARYFQSTAGALRRFRGETAGGASSLSESRAGVMWRRPPGPRSRLIAVFEEILSLRFRCTLETFPLVGWSSRSGSEVCNRWNELCKPIIKATSFSPPSLADAAMRRSVQLRKRKQSLTRRSARPPDVTLSKDLRTPIDVAEFRFSGSDGECLSSLDVRRRDLSPLPAWQALVSASAIIAPKAVSLFKVISSASAGRRLSCLWNPGRMLGLEIM